MSLRPYQNECGNAIRMEAIGGCNRQLVVLPTASGKTVVFAQLPQLLRMRRPDKMLVLVQAEELAFQSVEKLQAWNPSLRIGLEKAEYNCSDGDDIVVASVQTLGGTKKLDDGSWDWGKRLRRLDRDTFRYVVVDEAHHITAPNYHGIMRYFRVHKSDPDYNDPAKFLLGVTATPNRSDNKGLEAFFDKIVYQRDIRTMVSEGWLAKPEAHRVETMVSLDGVSVRSGPNGPDYATGELEERINTQERNNLIVDKYLELGEGLPFIALTVDIQHTIDLTETFQKRGVSCYGIASGKPRECEWLITKNKDRATAIEKYNNREFQGLISCQALLEGFDAPCATVLLWARPTKSTLLYTQGVGRVLRPFPAPEAADGWNGWSKRAAIIIDFVDNSVKHSLITAPTLMGLKPSFDAKGKNLVEVVEQIEKIKAAKPAVNLALYDSLDAIKGVAEKIDLFAVPTVPDEVKTLSPFAWTSGVVSDTYQLMLPDKGMLSVKVTGLGECEIAKHINGVKTIIGAAGSLADALRIADKNVPADAMILLKNDANWRKLQPTDSQLGLLKRLYPEMRSAFPTDQAFYRMVLGTYSRGEVSAMLSARDRRPARR